jgi:hypothetical protein
MVPLPTKISKMSSPAGSLRVVANLRVDIIWYHLDDGQGRTLDLIGL